jgi:hypothetical protein
MVGTTIWYNTHTVSLRSTLDHHTNHHYLHLLRSGRTFTSSNNNSCCLLPPSVDNMQQEREVGVNKRQYQLSIATLVPTNISMTLLRSGGRLTCGFLSLEACRDCVVVYDDVMRTSRGILVERSETVVVFLINDVIITILSSVARLSSSKLWKLFIVMYNNDTTTR